MSFFVKLLRFKDCDFGQFGTINGRYIIRPRNCSKLVQRSLFPIIDLLIGAKSITSFFIWRVGGGGDFHKNLKLKNKLSFYYI